MSINNRCQKKNAYFHLFNFQHLLLSSGIGQNVILSIFKNSWINFLPKFLKIKNVSIGPNFDSQLRMGQA